MQVSAHLLSCTSSSLQTNDVGWGGCDAIRNCGGLRGVTTEQMCWNGKVFLKLAPGILKKNFFLSLIHLFWERAHMSRGGAERGRENPKPALHGQCRAQHRAWTRELRDHDLSQSQTLNQLSHPGAPSQWSYILIIKLFLINKRN